MIEVGEDELICDLAETYHILNYKDIDPLLVGVLSCGLRENSRIKMKLSDTKITLSDMLLATLVDNTALLLWSKTNGAKKGLNRPKSVLNSILHSPAKDKYMKFSSIEEFEAMRKKILEG